MSDADVTVSEPDHPEVRAFWELARFHAKLNAASSYFGPTTLESVRRRPGPTARHPPRPTSSPTPRSAADGGATTAPLADYDGTLPRGGRALDPVRRRGTPRSRCIEIDQVEVGGDEVVEQFRVVYRGD